MSFPAPPSSMEPCLFYGFEEEKHLTVRAANCVQILLGLLCPQLLVPLLFLVTLVIHMPHILSISFFFFLSPPQPHWISIITLTPNPCLPGSHIALVMVSLLSEPGFWSSLLHQACGQRKKHCFTTMLGFQVHMDTFRSGFQWFPSIYTLLTALGRLCQARHPPAAQTN